MKIKICIIKMKNIYNKNFKKEKYLDKKRMNVTI